MVDTTAKKEDFIRFNYIFVFKDGAEKSFEVKLDRNTLALRQIPKEKYPDWTLLKTFQCPVCPLDSKDHKYCPVAASISDVIDFFCDHISYEEVDVVIESEQRRYAKNTSLQKGLSSLLGIFMVTTGCPVMEKLKPMVRYHMPFANPEETMYRVISMYLFAQYFLYKNKKRPDWDLKNLVKIYADIGKVNKSFSERLLSVSTHDANLNALTILQSFGVFVSFSIDEDLLERIEHHFQAYLIDTKKPRSGGKKKKK